MYESIMGQPGHLTIDICKHEFYMTDTNYTIMMTCRLAYYVMLPALIILIDFISVASTK